MAERLDIVSQSNFPTNKSNTVEIVTTTKKKVTTASASDIAELVTPAISNLDIATQTNFPIQSSDAQSDFIITTDGGVSNVTAEAAAGLISSYIPTGGGDPHKPDFTADYSENYSDFSNFTGSGTEADPYQIWDEEMFLNARFKVNNGGLSSATYFKQMRDIDWQFDGYGIGSKILYSYDETIYRYGVDSVINYLHYDGCNCVINIFTNNFEYKNSFFESLVNAPTGSLASASIPTLYMYILAGYSLENIKIDFKGKIYAKSDLTKLMRLNVLQNYGSTGKYFEISNIEIVSTNNKLDLYILFPNDYDVEQCIIKNIDVDLGSGTCGLVYAKNITNCIIENVKAKVDFNFGFIYCSKVINNLTLNNIDLRSSKGTIIYAYQSIQNLYCNNIIIRSNKIALFKASTLIEKVYLDGIIQMFPITNYSQAGYIFDAPTLQTGYTQSIFIIKKGGTTWTYPQAKLDILYNREASPAITATNFGFNSSTAYVLED